MMNETDDNKYHFRCEDFEVLFLGSAIHSQVMGQLSVDWQDTFITIELD